MEITVSETLLNTRYIVLTKMVSDPDYELIKNETQVKFQQTKTQSSCLVSLPSLAIRVYSLYDRSLVRLGTLY